MMGIQQTRDMPLILGIALMLMASTSLGNIPNDDHSALMGAGWFASSRPANCKPLPNKIFKADQVEGPIPTNDWWSSLAWTELSAAMFAHPLVLRAEPQGLSVTYPGSSIVTSERAIVGGAADGDLILGDATSSPFSEARFGEYSDWFVQAVFQKTTGVLRTNFGHGSPFVYVQHEGARPKITFAEHPVIWSRSADGSCLGISVRGRAYGLFGPAGSTWSQDEEGHVQLHSDRDFYSIALLPDTSTSTLDLFRTCAHRHVVGTDVHYTRNDRTIDTAFTFTTKAMEGGPGETLYSLYPHQWKHLVSKRGQTGLTYQSVRGDLQLFKGKGFTTTYKMQGMLPYLPAPKEVPDRLRSQFGQEPLALDPSKDTYWEGKQLGKLTTLAGVAEALSNTSRHNKAINTIRHRLERWLTFDGKQDAEHFYYDNSWGTLIGTPPSYGSDDQINDHHFHYGYFIRAAAEVARSDPDWAREWGPRVELLIRDVASVVPNDPLFPRLRHFDPYAGHSWASGHAIFGDGNNQESSSEAMNAWYGIALWGGATGNTGLLDLGLYLYNTELVATEEYWFDMDETNFADGFPKPALGIVWGGKNDYSTWFSAEPAHIHGINWLPFTPGSLYLGRSPAYVKRNLEAISLDPLDPNAPWRDLRIMYSAFVNAGNACDAARETTEVEGGNSLAFMNLWCEVMSAHGQIDASVQGDDPFSLALRHKDSVTYAVYNYAEAEKSVIFSDGHEMRAAPHQLTTQTVPTNKSK